MKPVISPLPIHYPALPVVEQRHAIIEHLQKHQVLILCGETGSGKTTQLPKICLEMGRGDTGLIGCTQPRRIAARSIANRLASELETQVGQGVGYQTRFQRMTSAHTRIKVMTDGILLAEIEHNRTLRAYDTLIIDEAHERSLNIDLLLGYCRWLLPRRPDLKLIITSATIDTERFSRHFDNAPILEISGRTYPVEVRYHPIEESRAEAAPSKEGPPERIQAIVNAVAELFRTDSGSILIFCSGEREIREASEALAHYRHQADILPLFARLSHSQQDQVFNPNGKRRIILATNVAETSLTVPGIHAVIDTGHARISRYNPHNKVQCLPIEAISRSSADQRKGRCGRLQNGVCIRLYSELDYLGRPAFTEPEILRTSLAATLLTMKILRLGDIQQFPFLDAPAPRLIKDAVRLLQELGALDPQEQLTPLGRQIARLPLDPRIARMVLAAQAENCVQEILIIAGALTAQDPRERPANAQTEADQAHRRFQDVKSDFSTYLTLWRDYQQAAKTLSRTQLRHWCRDHYLSWLRLNEWGDIHQQLLTIAQELKLPLNTTPAAYEAIHRALLSGLLGNIGCKQERQEYQGTRGSRWAIFPGSGLFKRSPAWCVSAERIETSRLYAHCVAQVEPEWIEQVAGPLCQRHYFEPHWQKNSGQVAGYERVTLYGLTLIVKRKINFGPLDPVLSREIFIRQALVAGELNTPGAFMAHNQALLHDIEMLENKVRRRDILVDEAQLYQFFDRLLPANLYTAAAFEQWRKQAEAQQPNLLYWQEQDLVNDAAKLTESQRYPEFIELNATRFDLSYCFNPGDEQDGITLKVPLAALNRLDTQRLEWLVPGLIQEKITALIKTLPKPIRRFLVPVPQYAEACWQALAPDYGQGCLYTALGQQLQRMTGLEIPPTAWRREELPPHLRVNIQLLDANAQVVAQHRDWSALQQQWGEQAQQQFRQTKPQPFPTTALVRWDFGDLPPLITWQQHGITLTGFPALVEQDEQVKIEIFETEAQAQQALSGGIRRLIMLSLGQDIPHGQKQRVISPETQRLYQMLIYQQPVAKLAAILSKTPAKAPTKTQVKTPYDLTTPLVGATLNKLLAQHPTLPRTANEFEALLRTLKPQFLPEIQQLAALVQDILLALQTVHTHQAELNNRAPAQTLAAIQQQVQQLVYPGFIENTPPAWLPHIPRYLTALKLRLQRWAQDPSKDQQKAQQIQPYWQAYLDFIKAHPTQATRQEIIAYRWLLEEFRVSLFAQELKTPIPVSAKRLQQHWQAIQAIKDTAL